MKKNITLATVTLVLSASVACAEEAGGQSRA